MWLAIPPRIFDEGFRPRQSNCLLDRPRMGRSDRAAFFIDGAFSRFAGVNLGAIVLKHEKTDRR